MKNVDLEKCSHCMVGKQIRVSFKKHLPSRKFELLELVHSNVCDPLKVKSFNSADMMNKALIRGKFKTCSKIVSLAVTPT